MRAKNEITDAILRPGLIAVIRTATADQAERIAEACGRAGVKALEITFTVPRAASVLEVLRRQFDGSDVVVGAGTVLDAETARIALLSGAEFVVSPILDSAAARMCNRYQTPYLPGVGTTTEVAKALAAGADLIKVFPGEVLGPAFIKAVKGPLPQAVLIPTGGVTIDNVKDWIRAGAAALGVGGNLIGQAPDDSNAVARNAKAFLDRIAEARTGVA
jgi:2-dehydro-3-deoxyphosphogluconate aldolase/(4S)-4-hydroxy-2-oxoglutarate aldolase